MAKNGSFIAIEGGDGVGKATQTEMLCQYFERLGRQALKLSFPQYGKPSAYYGEAYLNGVFGSADEVPADLAVLAFALDRFGAKEIIEERLNTPGGLVIADRYVTSNLAHQGTKFPDAKERHEFYERTMTTEYKLFGVPKPD